MGTEEEEEGGCTYWTPTGIKRENEWPRFVGWVQIPGESEGLGEAEQFTVDMLALSFEDPVVIQVGEIHRILPLFLVTRNLGARADPIQVSHLVNSWPCGAEWRCRTQSHLCIGSSYLASQQLLSQCQDTWMGIYNSITPNEIRLPNKIRDIQLACHPI